MIVKVEFECESVEELKKAMRELAGAAQWSQVGSGSYGVTFAYDTAPSPRETAPSETAPTEVTDAASPIQPASEPEKRKRRTKAELAADAAASMTQTSASSESQPAPATETTDGLEIPAFLKRDKPAAAEPARPSEPAKPVTIDDVRAAMSNVIAAQGAPAVFKLLAEFSARNTGKPAEKASELDPKDYPAMIARCNEVCA